MTAVAKWTPPTAEQLARPCRFVCHTAYGAWCEEHRKVMCCEHRCAALWRTPCDVAGCEDA